MYMYILARIFRLYNNYVHAQPSHVFVHTFRNSLCTMHKFVCCNKIYALCAVALTKGICVTDFIFNITVMLDIDAHE